MCLIVLLYFFCDVEVTGVDAVGEQILGAAALTGAEHAVVGLEQLPAGTGQHMRWRLYIISHNKH